MSNKLIPYHMCVPLSGIVFIDKTRYIKSMEYNLVVKQRLTNLIVRHPPPPPCVRDCELTPNFRGQ